MVNVPVRFLPLVDPTLYRTVPLPLPDAPSVIVIHESLLIAVQVQPAPAETATGAPGPPCSSISCPVGLIEYVQPEACVTVNVCPAIVSVPVLAVPVLAATL